MSSMAAAYGTSLSGDPAPKRRNPGKDHQHAECGDHGGVQLQRRPGQVGTLEHDVAQSIDRVGQRQHIRDVLEHLWLRRDGEEDAAQQYLRNYDQRNELHRLELSARKHAQEYAQVHRAQRHEHLESEDQEHVALVVDFEHIEREEQHLHGLNQGEDREAEHVADHDLAAAQRARHQPLERALRALTQERHDGDHEHEKEQDQTDKGGSEVIELVEIWAAVQVGGVRLEPNRR